MKTQKLNTQDIITIQRGLKSYEASTRRNITSASDNDLKAIHEGRLLEIQRMQQKLTQGELEL